MKKLLSITPHLSTGGAPQVLVKRVELVNEDLDIYVVEFSNISDAYVIQKNRLKKLLKPDHFFTLGENKRELLDIINKIQPDFIHFEEMPELFDIDFNITKEIYKKDRTYKIFETTHSSDFDVNNKLFFPDKFLFVSQYNCFKFNKFGIPSEVIEYPVEKRPVDLTIKESAMKRLKLDPKFKHVVNVGLFTPRKNQGYAMEIAKELLKENVKFHFIGNQAENFQDYWKPILKNKPKNCEIWGERDDIDDWLDACDLFLFTSRGFRWNKELNPLVIKEALEHQIPQFLFPLDVYNRKYDIESDTIHYLNGDIKIDAGLVRNFLFPREIKTDKKYKIRAVHLLLEEDNRKKDSIKELERIKDFGIDYVQHINKRYAETPPREFCARPNDVGRIGAYSLRGPHYGNYQSFKKAFFTEFEDGVDFLMILESDCKLTVPIEEFVAKVYQSCDEIINRNITYMSFGDNRNLRTGEMVSDNHGTINDWMYITNKIIGIQCIMFPRSARDFILRSYDTNLWDVSDLLFNDMFRNKTKAIAPRLTTQIEGISTIQGEAVTHFLRKDINNLVRDKNPDDIIVEFNPEDQKFHFCLSDFYQNDISDLSITVNADDVNGIYTTETILSPYNPVWIQVYGHQKYNEFHFDIKYKGEYLFTKRLKINMTPDSESVRKELQDLMLNNKEETDEKIKRLKDEKTNIKPEDFGLDYKTSENKLYLPYFGSEKDIILDVKVKDIETRINIFTADNLIFNNSTSINWISPGSSHVQNEDFCGFAVEYSRDSEILFTRELRFKEINKIKDIVVTEIKESKNMFVILTYPDTKIKEDITEECIEAIKSSGMKTLLASHYPVNKKLQDKVDYYLYDSYNPLIEHTLYKYFWSTMQEGRVDIYLDKLQNKSKLNQSLTVLNNIENSVKFAKEAGYDNIICCSYDFIFNNNDIDTIKNLCKRIDKENKNGYFMMYSENDMKLLKSVFFIINTEFYTKIFNTETRTPEQFNAECKRLDCHNFLEYYFYKKIMPYSKDLIIEVTDETKLFKNNNKINLFSGVEYMTVLPVKDQPNSFIFWFNSSNATDDRTINLIIENRGDKDIVTAQPIFHEIKDKKSFLKKFTIGKDDDYFINVSFTDSTDKEISKQVFNVNMNNIHTIRENGLFTENSSTTKEEEVREVKVEKIEKIKVDVSYDKEENKVYLTYNGEERVPCDIWITDIDSNFPIFYTKIEFSNESRNHWIFTGEPLYDMYEQFNGYKIFIKNPNNQDVILEKDFRLRNEPPVTKTKFKFETPCLEFRNYYEAFFDDVWKELELSSKDKVVIDIGSGVGTFTAYALEKGCKNIIGIEADDKCYKSTLNTFRNNKNVSFINKAVYSESNKELEFHYLKSDNTTYAGSLINEWINKEHHDNIITKKIKTISIDDIINLYNIQNIDAIKMDIEGGEYEIFDKISDHTLSKINRILLEFHMNLDNRLDYVIDKMKRNGFNYKIYKMRSKFLNRRIIEINEGLGMGNVIFYK
jgi:FkbM family methyltransferase